MWRAAEIARFLLGASRLCCLGLWLDGSIALKPEALVTLSALEVVGGSGDSLQVQVPANAILRREAGVEMMGGGWKGIFQGASRSLCG